MRTPKPTTAKPGSEMKIAVLQFRVAHRQELWHPLDYREATINTITITPTGADRAAMRQTLPAVSTEKLRVARKPRMGFYREPK